MGKPSVNVLIGCAEAAVTESMRLILAGACDITTSTSFKELVQTATAGNFHVVIVYGNCMSPPMICNDGLLVNTALAIKTIKAARPVPVIAVTSMEDWSEPLLAAGADVCLGTPLNAVELREAVSRYQGDVA
jgi:CheY-like chemotaxis protein